jgi:hypothetical protein
MLGTFLNRTNILKFARNEKDAWNQYVGLMLLREEVVLCQLKDFPFYFLLKVLSYWEKDLTQTLN